ncbi:MAG: hypothetical protein ACK5XO_11165 [Phycisphaerales bacterium]|nr:hypothetical protein [Phycisphaeraceae bacterium]
MLHTKTKMLHTKTKMLHTKTKMLNTKTKMLNTKMKMLFSFVVLLEGKPVGAVRIGAEPAHPRTPARGRGTRDGTFIPAR